METPEKAVPYIGITDFETIDQILKAIHVFEKLSKNKKQQRKLMVGIMTSYKILRGLETKWAGIYPPKECIGELFIPNPLVLNTLHYADYIQKTIAFDLIEALEWANSKNGLDAVQLDMIWPRPDMMQKVRESFQVRTGKFLPFVLQVGSRAVKACGTLDQVIQRVGKYREVADYILLDFSGGTGVPLDATELRKYILEIKNKYPKFSIAVAGKLGPYTMGLVQPLIDEFPDISIDSQSQGHVNGDAMKPVDPKRQAKYLRAAAARFP